MSKKNKTIKVATITAIDIFNMQKTQYNGFGVGHGAHGHKGYDRRKEKKNFQRELRNW